MTAYERLVEAGCAAIHTARCLAPLVHDPAAGGVESCRRFYIDHASATLDTLLDHHAEDLIACLVEWGTLRAWEEPINGDESMVLYALTPVTEVTRTREARDNLCDPARWLNT